MNVLLAEKISKSYSEKNLLDEISISVNEGEKIGLIGINGTGKSTLLKMLAGMESPDRGRVFRGNDVKIEYLTQSPRFEDGTTVLEQVFKGNSPVMKLIRDYEEALQGVCDHPGEDRFQKRLIALTHKMDQMGAWTIENEAKSILTKLGIAEFKEDVGKLSGGQRKRVALASVLITPSDLLILDEPTNHIDNDTVDWLEKYINKRKGALLMVTHDRYLLDRVANRIVEIDGGKLYSYQANYSNYLEKKVEREEASEASERKRRSLLRSELEWIRRGARARTTKQKARIERFENLSEQRGPAANGSLEMQGAFSRLGRKVIEFDGVGKSFPCGRVVNNFNYVLLRDDRIGIIGPNGCGKSTLMKMAAGILKPDTGEVVVGETVKIGYFSQENEEMDDGLRVIEYIREQAEFFSIEGKAVSASQMLERFLFPPNVQWTPISKLSGGEKRRLHLLRILMGAPNVLMLDEPTNDLDIQTLTILETYLDEFPGAVIVVSHDRYFLDRVVDTIFSFEGEGEFRQYPGNYTDYRRLAQNGVSSEKDESVSAVQRKAAGKEENNADKPLKFTFKEQREFERIDDVIFGFEEEIRKVSKRMHEASSDFEQLQELSEEKERLEKMLEGSVERWAYLNELFEEIERNKRGG